MQFVKSINQIVNMPFPKGTERTAHRSRQPSNGIKIDPELIVKAIQKTRGNLARAADSIGISRTSLQAIIKKSEDLQIVLSDCRERFLDEGIDVMQNKALSGDSTLLMFALKNLGRHRGFDMERDVVVESATRGVLEFIQNQSKNPAES
jgi:hypothetical protein